MKPEEQYIIDIIRSAVNGEALKTIDNVDWEKLIEIAAMHKIDGILYYSLSSSGQTAPKTVMDVLSNRYNMYIATEAVQELALAELLEVFEQSGIKSVPLKGSVLKYYYPSPELRSSGDIDVLIEEEDTEKVDRIMKDLGYEQNHSFDVHAVHMVYTKKPNIMIEIHRKLVSERNREYEFCKEAWDNVVLREGKNYTYNFTKEFLYVYIVAHLCKHLRNGGAGIRLVLDIWVLLKKWRNGFDKDKLAEMISKAKLEDIERWSADVAEFWFSEKKELSETETLLAEYIIESGVFGTVETHKKMHANKPAESKVDQLSYMVFLPLKNMQKLYPMLNKIPFLLPVFWIVRIFDRVFRKKAVKRSMDIAIGEKNEIDEQFKRISRAVA